MVHKISLTDNTSNTDSVNTENDATGNSMSLLVNSQHNMNLDLRKVADEFRRLSELCILAIRVELRLWTFVFLNYVRYVPYIYDVEYDKEPDHFCVDLNKHLFICYETISQYLPRDKILYLFGSLPSLMTRLLMLSLNKIKKGMNKFGVMKMRRNIFSLQQNFTNMSIPVSETQFDRVRKYYSLLESKPQELIEKLEHQIAERSNPFTKEEFMEVIKFLSPNKNIPGVQLKHINNLFGGVEVSVSQ